MRISLIYPNAPVATIDHKTTLRDKIPELVFHGGKHFTAPSSLTSLEAEAKEMGHEVKSYYELGSRQLGFAELQEIAESDITGISTMTLQATRAYEIGSMLKTVYGLKGTLVYGGKHITGTYQLKTKGISEYFDQAFENGMADAVFVGEAFKTWPKFLTEYPDITERLYVDPYYQGEKRPDLFSIPTPDRSQLPLGDFTFPFSMLLGIGCIYNCRSCSVAGGLSMRPLEEIISELDEIMALQKKTGMDSFLNRLLRRNIIFFVDNDLHLYSEFYKISKDKGFPRILQETLEAVKKHHRSWVTQAGYNAGLDTDFLDMCADTGCKGIFFGFETASQENLKSLGKNQNRIEKYRDIVKNCEERGILVMSNYMFGLPHDTEGCGRETFERIQKDRVHIIATNFYTPLPGSEFFMDCHSNKLFLGNPTPSEWWRYNGGRVLFNPENIPAGKLYLEHEEFRDLVYKPSNALKRLLKSKLPLDQKLTAFIANMMFGMGMRPRKDEHEVFEARMQHYGLKMP